MLASFLRRALPAATLVVVAIVGAGDLCARATPVDAAGRDTVRPHALAPVTVTGARLAPAAGAWSASARRGIHAP